MYSHGVLPSVRIISTFVVFFCTWIMILIQFKKYFKLFSCVSVVVFLGSRTGTPYMSRSQDSTWSSRCTDRHGHRPPGRTAIWSSAPGPWHQRLNFKLNSFIWILVTCDVVGRTYDVVRPDLRHRRFDLRRHKLHRAYDIVRAMLSKTSDLRCLKFSNIVGLTHDFVGQTYDVVCLGKCKSYTMW
jgi:hypothetical protein